MHHPHVVASLRDHGITTNILEIRIGRITTRNRLRSGEKVGNVIAGLFELRNGNTAAA
ncbi:hypothetical protein [Streptomyces sp. SAT1]|uniref:hypothetical protein n=1 Tax=Streptomyces sp. SAT1 TaxID=1849967 RepID=UPI0013317902|nr:hypothetical protein [Streptomyces sp. SAT1]